MCKSLLRHQKQQWGSVVAEAALRADADVVDVGDSAITMEADNISITETTAATIGREDPPYLVVTMVHAALLATILVEGTLTESALASFVAPPGIKPNSALRQDNTLSESLEENIRYKAMSFYEWSSPHDAKLKIQL